MSPAVRGASLRARRLPGICDCALGEADWSRRSMGTWQREPGRLCLPGVTVYADLARKQQTVNSTRQREARGAMRTCVAATIAAGLSVPGVPGLTRTLPGICLSTLIAK